MGGAQSNIMVGAQKNIMGGASVGGIEDKEMSKQILPEKTTLKAQQMCDNGHFNMNRKSDVKDVDQCCNSKTTAELDGNGNTILKRQGDDPEMERILNDYESEEVESGPRNNDEATSLHFSTKSENQVCAFPKTMPTSGGFLICVHYWLQTLWCNWLGQFAVSIL